MPRITSGKEFAKTAKGEDRIQGISVRFAKDSDSKLVCIDIDTKILGSGEEFALHRRRLAEEIISKIPESLKEKLVIEKSMNWGIHIWFYLPELPEIPVKWVKHKPEGKDEAEYLFEFINSRTKNGGQVLVYPSYGYSMINDKVITEATELAPDEFSELRSICESYMNVEPERIEIKTREERAESSSKKIAGMNDWATDIDQAVEIVKQKLIDEGYELVSTEPHGSEGNEAHLLRRPGTDNKYSVAIDTHTGVIYPHSSNTMFEGETGTSSIKALKDHFGFTTKDLIERGVLTAPPREDDKYTSDLDMAIKAFAPKFKRQVPKHVTTNRNELILFFAAKEKLSFTKKILNEETGELESHTITAQSLIKKIEGFKSLVFRALLEKDYELRYNIIFHAIEFKLRSKPNSAWTRVVNTDSFLQAMLKNYGIDIHKEKARSVLNARSGYGVEPVAPDADPIRAKFESLTGEGEPTVEEDNTLIMPEADKLCGCLCRNSLA
jgi:hypothetical protein